jgi:hypothetical protein
MSAVSLEVVFGLGVLRRLRRLRLKQKTGSQAGGAFRKSMM